ncbi:HSFY1 protein, partial [Bucorvus abyssinicus]|nr:HSFY1 protein [Bucorvus abyssinicus]
MKPPSPETSRASDPEQPDQEEPSTPSDYPGRDMGASGHAATGSLADKNTLQSLPDESGVPTVQFCYETNPSSDHSFVRKLWKIISSPCFRSIWWGDDGSCFVIAEKFFIKEVLGRMGPQKIFNISSMRGFIHNLNHYGFHEVGRSVAIYSSIQELRAIAAARSPLGKVLWFLSIQKSPQDIQARGRGSHSDKISLYKAGDGDGSKSILSWFVLALC